MTVLERKLEQALLEYVERYGLSERARQILIELQRESVKSNSQSVPDTFAEEVPCDHRF